MRKETRERKRKSDYRQRVSTMWKLHLMCAVWFAMRSWMKSINVKCLTTEICVGFGISHAVPYIREYYNNINSNDNNNTAQPPNQTEQKQSQMTRTHFIAANQQKKRQQQHNIKLYVEANQNIEKSHVWSMKRAHTNESPKCHNTLRADDNNDAVHRSQYNNNKIFIHKMQNIPIKMNRKENRGRYSVVVLRWAKIKTDENPTTD